LEWIDKYRNRATTPILAVLFISVISPLLIGILLDDLHIVFISVPLHSALESLGGLMAVLFSLILFSPYNNSQNMSYLHWTAVALLGMGIIDIFHAIIYPGEAFVWLHSFSMLFGGFALLSIWLPERRLSKKLFYGIPIGVIVLTASLSILSIFVPDSTPDMFDSSGRFGGGSVFLNIVSGLFFIIASLKFLSNYLQFEKFDDLLFMGHTLLFGVSGFLFLTSEIWDVSWWFLHLLRFTAYSIAFYYIYRRFVSNQRDLEDRKVELEKNNSSLQDALSLSMEYQKAVESGSIVSKSDLYGNITHVNRAFLELTGYKESEIIGQPHSVLRDPLTSKNLYWELWRTIKSGKVWKGTLRGLTKSGDYFYTRTTIVPIYRSDRTLQEYVALRENITELVRNREELRDVYNRDSLTGFGNRFKLFSDLEHRDSGFLALLNIDAFKEINDFYGETIGDEVIREMGSFIANTLKDERYKIYRVQADEFAVVPNIKDFVKSEFISSISKIVKDVKSRQFSIGDIDIYLNLSAGISEGERSTLFKSADIALKTAKKEKLDTLFYHTGLKTEEEYKNNLIWTAKIKKAIKNDRIVPYFQPILNINSGGAKKFEALMRLIDEDGKVISPFLFLHIAKKSKLYVQLTKIIFDKVLLQMEKYGEYEFSINLSLEDIKDRELVNYIKERMDENESLRKQLIFEIVESEGIDNFEEMDNFISWAKDIGIRVAIDDFGTGYSNFTYLIKLEADFVKIDGSMIKNIDKDENGRAVVETIVAFAKKSGMRTVAEFVSDSSVFEIVKNLGIDFAQGYYVDMPKGDVSELKLRLL
jgi:diguanylate cyclase (GGDEF)-like protein/PAS domain S-box-containing protein